MNKVSIYRNGSLTPAVYSGEVLAYATEADKDRPAGRPGRVGSLYASPTLAGVCRWTRANLMSTSRRDDPETYELRVDVDKVYVYSVEAWEEYSWYGAPASVYWETGMVLSEWLGRDDLDATQWEVLVSPDSIFSLRRVSRGRLLASGGDTMDDLGQFLKLHRVQ